MASFEREEFLKRRYPEVSDKISTYSALQEKGGIDEKTFEDAIALDYYDNYLYDKIRQEDRSEFSVSLENGLGAYEALESLHKNRKANLDGKKNNSLTNRIMRDVLESESDDFGVIFDVEKDEPLSSFATTVMRSSLGIGSAAARVASSGVRLATLATAEATEGVEDFFGGKRKELTNFEKMVNPTDEQIAPRRMSDVIRDVGGLAGDTLAKIPAEIQKEKERFPFEGEEFSKEGQAKFIQESGPVTRGAIRGAEMLLESTNMVGALLAKVAGDNVAMEKFLVSADESSEAAGAAAIRDSEPFVNKAAGMITEQIPILISIISGAAGGKVVADVLTKEMKQKLSKELKTKMGKKLVRNLVDLEKKGLIKKQLAKAIREVVKKPGEIAGVIAVGSALETGGNASEQISSAKNILADPKKSAEFAKKLGITGRPLKPSDFLKPGVAAAYGTAGGVLEAILPFGMLSKFVPKKMLNSLKDRTVGAMLKKIAGGTAEGVITEGVTEGLQESLSIMAAQWLKENEPFLSKENVERIWGAMKQGGLVGGFFSGAGSSVQSYRELSKGRAKNREDSRRKSAIRATIEAQEGATDKQKREGERQHDLDSLRGEDGDKEAPKAEGSGIVETMDQEIEAVKDIPQENKLDTHLEENKKINEDSKGDSKEVLPTTRREVAEQILAKKGEYDAVELDKVREQLQDVLSPAEQSELKQAIIDKNGSVKPIKVEGRELEMPELEAKAVDDAVSSVKKIEDKQPDITPKEMTDLLPETKIEVSDSKSPLVDNIDDKAAFEDKKSPEKTEVVPEKTNPVPKKTKVVTEESITKDLLKKKKDELLSVAKKEGVKHRAIWTKKRLIEAIGAKRNGEQVESLPIHAERDKILEVYSSWKKLEALGKSEGAKVNKHLSSESNANSIARNRKAKSDSLQVSFLAMQGGNPKDDVDSRKTITSQTNGAIDDLIDLIPDEKVRFQLERDRPKSNTGSVLVEYGSAISAKHFKRIDTNIGNLTRSALKEKAEKEGIHLISSSRTNSEVAQEYIRMRREYAVDTFGTDEAKITRAMEEGVPLDELKKLNPTLHAEVTGNMKAIKDGLKYDDSVTFKRNVRKTALMDEIFIHEENGSFINATELPARDFDTLFESGEYEPYSYSAYKATGQQVPKSERNRVVAEIKNIVQVYSKASTTTQMGILVREIDEDIDAVKEGRLERNESDMPMLSPADMKEGDDEEMPFSKEREKGKAKETKNFSTVEEVLEEIENFKKENKTASGTKVVVLDEKLKGENSDVFAYRKDDTVYLILPNITKSDVDRLMRHEDFVHGFLESILGKTKFKEMLVDAVIEENDLTKESFKTYRDTYRGNFAKIQEETLATIAERDGFKADKITTIKKFINSIKGALNKLGFNYSTLQVQDFMQDAYSKYKTQNLTKAETKDSEARFAKRKKDLVAIHNTSVEGVEAIREFRLPAPSIAITKDNVPFMSFGDISLVLPEQAVDPKNGAKVFDSDVYSPRQPKPIYDIDKRKMDEIEKSMQSSLDDAQETGIRSIAGVSGYMEKGDIIRDFVRSDAGKLAYIRSLGLDAKIPMRLEPMTDPTLRKNKAIVAWVKNNLLSQQQEFTDKQSEELKSLLRSHVENKPKATKPDKEFFLERYPELYEKGHMPIGDRDYYVRDLMKLKSKKKVLNTIKLGNRLDSKIKSRKSFENWARKKLTPMFVRPKVRSGERKIEYTAENVMRVMMGKGTVAKEGSATAGAVRAAGARPFKTLQQMIDSSDSIKTEEDFREYKEASESVMDGIMNDILPTYEWSAYGENSALEGMVESAKNPSRTRQEMAKAGYSDITDNDIDNIKEYLAELRKAPTTYFEAKSKEILELGDFVAAIVPKGEDTKILDEAGIPTYEYKKYDGKSWTKAINKANREVEGGVKFSKPRVSPIGFYSQKDDVLKSLNAKSMKASSLLSKLSNGGVTKDELEYSGIKDFLEGKKQEKVDIDDVLRMSVDLSSLDNAQPRKYNVILSNGETETFDTEEEAETRMLAEEEWIREEAFTVDLDEDSDNGGIMYVYDHNNSEVVVATEVDPEDGTWLYGESYLDDGAKETGNRESAEKFLESFAERGRDDLLGFIDRDTNESLDRGAPISGAETEEGVKYQEYSIKGGENYGESLVALESEDGKSYQSSHWDFENVIGHIRHQKFGDNFLIEEIQSDWHQDGRKKGYADDGIEKSLAKKHEIHDELNDKIREARIIGDETLVESLKKERGEITSSIQDLAAKRGRMVPQAPFKKTWPLMLFKRALKLAVDSGSKEISIVGGKESADRYKLSNHIDTLEYIKTKDGKYRIIGLKGNTRLFHDQNISESELAGKVGKDVSIKIVEDEGKWNAKEDMKELSGLDLDVGGEGMKAFYDKMLPDVAGSYLKKLDKGVRFVENSIKGEGVLTAKITDKVVGKVNDGQVMFSKPRIGKSIPEMESIKISGSKPKTKAVDVNSKESSKDSDDIRFSKPKKKLPIAEILAKLPTAKNQPANINWGMPPAVGKQAMLRAIGRNLKEKFVRKFQDDLNRLRMVTIAIQNQGGIIADQINSYMLEEIHTGIIKESLAKLKTIYQDPIINKIRALKKAGRATLDDVEAYLYAKHAPEANVAILNRKEDGTGPANESGSGMTDSESERILKNIDARGLTAEMEEISDMIVAMREDYLDMLVAKGLETQDTVNAWRNLYKYYIPLKSVTGVSMTGNGEGRGGRRFVIRGEESMIRLGRNQKASNLIANAFVDVEDGIIRGERNAIGNAFLQMVRLFPNKDLWEIRTWKGDLKLQVNEEGMLVNDNIIDSLKIDEKKAFTTKVDGSEVVIEIHDPIFAQQMNWIGKGRLGWTMTMMGKFVRFKAGMSTSFNPWFISSNFQRDLLTAGINANAEDLMSFKDSLKLVGQNVKNVPKILAALSDAQGKFISKPMRLLLGDRMVDSFVAEFNDFRMAGGETAFNDVQNIESKIKSINRLVNEGKIKKGLKGVFRIIEEANTAIESAARLSIYTSLREKGASKIKAASAAKNITVNFNKKGELGAAMNALYMFSGASIQGNTTMVRALSKSKVARRIAYGITTTALGLALMNRMLGGKDPDDDEYYYDKLPDYIKNNYIIYYYAPGKYYKLWRLPYGYNIFHAIGDTTYDTLVAGKGASHAVKRVMGSIMDSFNPVSGGQLQGSSVSPTVGRPFAEIGFNENWYGGKVMPQEESYGRKLKDHERYWPNSVNPISKFITDTLWNNGHDIGLDISPNSIDHFVKDTFGGLGKNLMDLVSSKYKQAKFENGTGMKPPIRDNVFERMVHGENTGYGDRRKYKDYTDEYARAKANYRYNENNLSKDIAEEELENNPNDKFYLSKDVEVEMKYFARQLRILGKKINKAKKDNNKIRASQKGIMSLFDINIDDQDFKDNIKEIEALEKEKLTLMKQANKFIKDEKEKI